MTYQQWITNNWLFLQKWSRIWCDNSDDADELIGLFTIYLNDNWLKFSTIPDGDERIKFTQTWMKNNVRWSNSLFNKQKRVNNLGQEWEQKDSYDDMIEVRCETDRGDIRDWLLDLTRNYSDTQVEKLVRLREIYLTLTTAEKVLWDLHFTNGLSLRKIGHKLNLSHMSIFTMLRDLKQKIRDKYGYI